MTAVDDLREQLETQLRALVAAEAGAREGREGAARELHRFRVATRRTRALIRASRPLVRDQLASLDRELRWLGGLSGPVRDLDVLIERLRGAADELEPDREGVEAIVGALERERARGRELLIAALDSPRYLGLKSRFESSLPALAESGDGASPTRLARKEFDRLQVAHAELGANPSDEDLHAVRIRAKHLRFAAEFAARSGGKPLTAVAKAARALQDVIGAHQDAVVAEQRIRGVVGENLLLAAGRIVEREHCRRRESRAALPEAWRHLERAAAKVF